MRKRPSGRAAEAAQLVEPADVEHVPVERAADPRRVDVGAAGQHGQRLPRQRVERVAEAVGAQVG
jgi:hypothetical protein